MGPTETTEAVEPQKEGAADVRLLRQRIDAIDDQLMELILKRIELSTFVMKIKPPSQTVDRSREQAIIGRYFEKLAGASTMTKTKRLVLGIIGASKSYPDA